MSVARQIMVMVIILSIILLFVGIGLLIFVHICIVGRALRRGFGSNSLNSMALVERGNSNNTTRSTSMSQDDLEKLPCFDYVTKETTTTTTATTISSTCSEPVDCAVCLEAFQDGERCRLLPVCMHSFHAQCVDVWLLKTPFCPICRASAETTERGCRLSLGRDVGGDDQFGSDIPGVELQERERRPELAV